MLNEKNWEEFDRRISDVTKGEMATFGRDGSFSMDGELSCAQMIELGKIMVEVQRTIMEVG